MKETADATLVGFGFLLRSKGKNGSRVDIRKESKRTRRRQKGLKNGNNSNFFCIGARRPFFPQFFHPFLLLAPPSFFGLFLRLLSGYFLAAASSLQQGPL